LLDDRKLFESSQIEGYAKWMAGIPNSPKSRGLFGKADALYDGVNALLSDKSTLQPLNSLPELIQ
jgi:hypothetical protein